MMKAFWALVLILGTIPAHAASPDWHQRLNELVPLLGHRNWILVVDSAYPLQIAPGVETIDTGASQMDVLRTVMADIDHSIQLRPVFFRDAELPLISDADAPGASAYREQLNELLHDYTVVSQPHEKLIAREHGDSLHVGVHSVRLQILDCRTRKEPAVGDGESTQ
jgi:D-ribose pyranose/furanose isomerase RbsD